MNPDALVRTLAAAAHACGDVELDDAAVDDLELLADSSDVVMFELVGMQSKIRAACWRAVNNTPRPVPTKPVQPRPAPPPKDPKGLTDAQAVAEAHAIVAEVMRAKGLGPHLFVVPDVDQ